MRPTSVAAAALALLCACGRGYTNAQAYLPDGAIIPIGGGSEGGDGGTVRPDAGDGGIDAGAGGCAPIIRTNLRVIDNCAQPSANSYGGSIGVSAQCAVQIFTGTATSPCIGVALGSSNAFDGGCGGGHTNCASAALPGTINCAMPIPCSIQICDGGTCP